MLLALDTATRTISLAIHDGAQLVIETTWRTGDYHTVELAPQAAQLLQRAHLAPDQLQGVAVALGPGSYTGLRIGLGFAKGLALAHPLALIGVPTHAILMRAQAPRPEPVMALVTAGRGRVSAARYHWENGWQQTEAPRVLTWALLADAVREPTYFCGDIDEAGYAVLRAHPQALLSPASHSVRRAGYLAEIGWERLRAGRTDDPAQLVPLYGSPPEGSGV